MSRIPTGLSPLVELSRKHGHALFRQLDARIRELILDGRLRPGTRLPGSRILAEELGLSRMTVVAAYDRLTGAGFLESRPKSGTFVREPPRGKGVPVTPHDPPGSPPGEDQRFAFQPFRGGAVAVADFPFRAWSEALSDATAFLQSEGAHADRAAIERLCTVLSEHVAARRGVRCEPRQIFLTTGLYATWRLVIEAVVRPGDTVLVESPGSPLLHGVLLQVGARTVPMEVDEDGARIGHALGEATAPVAVFVTPCAHFPTGAPLAPARIAQLVARVAPTEGWIVEDDHDVDLLCGPRTAPAIHGLAPNRTIYVGGLSSVLHPVARLGFAVVPSELVPRMRSAAAVSDARSFLGGRPAAHTLAAAAHFIESGSLDGCALRVRRAQAERKRALTDALEGFPAQVRVDARHPLHTLLWLPDEWDDREGARVLERSGIIVEPLSPCFLNRPHAGFLLGSAAFGVEELGAAAARLRAAWPWPFSASG